MKCALGQKSCQLSIDNIVSREQIKRTEFLLITNSENGPYYCFHMSLVYFFIYIHHISTSASANLNMKQIFQMPQSPETHIFMSSLTDRLSYISQHKAASFQDNGQTRTKPKDNVKETNASVPTLVKVFSWFMFIFCHIFSSSESRFAPTNEDSSL